MSNYLAAKKPIIVLVFLGAITLVSFFILSGLRMDNSIDVWFAREDPELEFYDEYRERFGTEEFFLLCLADNDAFSEETMGFVQDLTEELEEFEELQKVESLSKVYSQWAPARADGELPNDLETFREDTLNSPFFRGLLVSPDGRDAAIMCNLTPKGTADRQALVEKVEAMVAEVVPEERVVHFAGPAVFNAELNRMSRKSSITFYPLIVVAGAILLVFVLRSPTVMATVWIAVLVTVVWGLSSMVASGRTLNVVTSALPPILLVSTISYSLHLLLEYRRQLAAGCDKQLALRNSLDAVSIPCLLSALTTSIGFWSLMVSQVGPVDDLGTFAGISVLGGYVAVIFGVTAMVRLLPIPRGWKASEGEGVDSTDQTVKRHFGYQAGWHSARWLIVLAGVVYTAVSAWYASQVYFEANPFKFFPQESAFAQRLVYLQDHLTGLSRSEIQIQRKDKEPLLTLKDLERIESVEQKISELEPVKKVIAAPDFVKEARRAHSLGDESAYQLPRREMQLRQTINGLFNESFKERMNSYFAEDNRYTKVTINSISMGSRGFGDLLDEIGAILESELEQDYEYRITGLIPLVDSSQAYMVTSQVKSILVALVSISLTFVILLRSVRLTILGLLPNLIPILGTFGYMGWRDMPLDVATIMVASVSLGIVVDNTIHFLFRYKRNLKEEGPNVAVVKTLRTSGQAITFAAVINSLGFAVLMLSGFQPMRNFGVLVSLTMVSALFGATLLLPALLVTLGPGKNRNSQEG